MSVYDDRANRIGTCRTSRHSEGGSRVVALSRGNVGIRCTDIDGRCHAYTCRCACLYVSPAWTFVVASYASHDRRLAQRLVHLVMSGLNSTIGTDAVQHKI